jgi:hypothetical protein
MGLSPSINDDPIFFSFWSLDNSKTAFSLHSELNQLSLFHQLRI